MKKYILSTLFLIFEIFCTNAQNEIEVMPPSPNASSILQYGNNNVSYYTGAVGISIPIYTVQSGELSLNINLNYTGSNGIKVEEHASTAGIGWALNAGGNVSRTVRNIPDDILYGSFTTDFTVLNDNIENIPQETIDEFDQDILDIKNRHKDGQPDEFHYSFNGNSGSFFIDITNNGDMRIIQKPFTNNKIEPIFNSSNFAEGLKAFRITDPNGNIYLFEKEETFSKQNFDPHYNYSENVTMTWYLTKIQNHNQNKEITLTYKHLEDLEIKNRVPLAIYQSADPSVVDQYSVEHIFDAYRIEYINFPEGSVHFLYASDERKDKAKDVRLEKITVENKTGRIIKDFNLYHSYFNAHGSVSLNEANTEIPYGNEELRLKLDSVKERGMPSYIFEYENEVFLPSRYSFAQDHWGYYNGRTDNTSLEHKYTISYQTIFDDYEVIHTYGNADRNSNGFYAKAGILKKITYPTGGKTVFEYEANSAVIPSDNVFFKEIQTINTVIEESETNGIGVTKTVIVSDPECMDISNRAVATCPKKVFINAETPFHIEPGETIHLIKPPGTYQIYWEDDHFGCDVDLDFGIEVKTYKTINNVSKEVGGVRIKAIYNIENGKIASLKEFEYKDENEETSGRLVSVPCYGYKVYGTNYNPDEPINYECQFIDWRRVIYSTVPLTFTKGNVVGYKNVSETVFDTKTSWKKEYEYSSSDSYPDFFLSWHHKKDDIPFTCFNDTLDSTLETVNRELNPFVPGDKNDVARGLLLKQLNYQSCSDCETGYKIISEKENKYDALNVELFVNMIHLENELTDSIIGLKYMNALYAPLFNFSFYEYRSNYAFIKRETNKTYYDGIVLDQITEYFYDIYNDNDANKEYPVYSPVKTTTTFSDGKSSETVSDFTRDYNLYNLENDENTAMQEMLNRNIITPFQTKTKVNHNLTKTTRTNYKLFDAGGLQIKSKEFANAEEPLEEEIFFDKYDQNGNLIEFHYKNGIHTAVIYAYNYSLPVAKIENATIEQVYAELAEIGTDINSIQNLSDTQSEILFNSLRQAMPNSTVVSATYIPLTGQSSITDINGNKNEYIYNSDNRLINIFDNDNNLTKNTEYNFVRNQDDNYYSLYNFILEYDEYPDYHFRFNRTLSFKLKIGNEVFNISEDIPLREADFPATKEILFNTVINTIKQELSNTYVFNKTINIIKLKTEGEIPEIEIFDVIFTVNGYEDCFNTELKPIDTN